MNTKYQKLIDEFFDKIEKEENELKRKKKAPRIVLTSTIALEILSFVIMGLTGSETAQIVAGVFSLISFIAIIFAIKELKHLSKSITELIKKSELTFFDDVFIKIVAEEIGGTSSSFSYKNFEFEKALANPGDEISHRVYSIQGNYNGREYTISDSCRETVAEVIRHERTGINVACVPNIVRTGFNYVYRVRRSVPCSILLTPKEKTKKPLFRKRSDTGSVVMDNSNFRFNVECDDEIEAYKFLTENVMEEYNDWNEKFSIKQINVAGEDSSVIINNKLIDLDYKPIFTKNINKNRNKYNGQSVYEEAKKSIENVVDFLSRTPAGN